MKERLTPSISTPQFINILDEKRKETFKQLTFTRECGLYLSGGTVLALYLNHRTSIDFDFYTPEEFKENTLSNRFEKALPSHKLNIIDDIPNTLQLAIDDIHLSCFYYPYALIRELQTFSGVNIASLEDAAAMKALAIAGRGKQRDFIDVYYLTRKYGVKTFLEWTHEKYPNFSIHYVLRGLIYFEDAERDKEKGRIEVFDKSLTWTRVKTYISDSVLAYQRNFLKDE